MANQMSTFAIVNENGENAIMDGLMKKLRLVTTGGNRRRNRQRSSSIVGGNNGLAHSDSVSLRARRMLQSIQSEDAATMLTASPVDTLAHTGSSGQLDPPLASPLFARKRRTSVDVQGQQHHLLQTPISATSTSFFPQLMASRSTSTRFVRTRKTSKRPPAFDASRSSLPTRMRARRFSTK